MTAAIDRSAMYRASRLSAVLTMILAVPSISFAQSKPAGEWTDTFEWGVQVGALKCKDPNGMNPCEDPVYGDQEFAAAALISRGQYAGKVLLWRLEYDPDGCGCKASPQTKATWMVDPSNPGTLYRIDLQTNPDDPQQPEFRALPSAIFCAGQSWDKAGRLVVAGGQPLNPMLPSTTAYKFDPNALASATITPGSPIVLTEGGPRIWDALGPMAIGRYYPTLITLNKDPVLLSDAHACTNPDPRDGSSSLILGGPPLVTNEGNEFWEMHSPRLTNWYCPLVPEGLSSTSGGHWPSGGLPHDDFSLHPDTDPPEPLLDTYPRAFQTEVGGRIFVAGDTDTANSPPNAPGSSWVIKLRYDSGNPDSQLWRGPTTASVPGPDPTFDRFYDSVVLLHEFDQNGPKPGRIITWGFRVSCGSRVGGRHRSRVIQTAQKLQRQRTAPPRILLIPTTRWCLTVD